MFHRRKSTIESARPAEKPAVATPALSIPKRFAAHLKRHRLRYLLGVVLLICIIVIATVVPIVVTRKKAADREQFTETDTGPTLQPLPKDLATPLQQRVAMMGPASVAVAWNTFSKLDKPCVRYGKSATQLDQHVCSTDSSTYPTSRTWANKVTLSNLSPFTKYYYHVGPPNATVLSFTTARPAGDKTPFTFNVVADLGVYGEEGYTISGDNLKRSTIPSITPSMNHTTIGRLTQTLDDYDFIIHPGDLGYADDWDFKKSTVYGGHNAFQAILETFYEQLAPVSGNKPYMVSPGNHEAACKEDMGMTHKCPLGQRNFTDFMHRFSDIMPTAWNSTSTNDTAKVHANAAHELANPPFWYSFEYGMVHITMIDTETDFPHAPDEAGGYSGLDSGPFGAPNQQIQFLEADLASVDRSVTPWVIVAGHRPWYARGGHGHDGFHCAPCQDAFEDIFYRYGVDVGVFGHVHNSQRFLPVYKSVADPAGLNNPKAPMYIIAGAAGSVEGLSSLGADIAFSPWGDSQHFAYATMRVQDANHLKIEFVQSSNGKVLDSSTLIKEHGQKFVVQ